MSSGTCSRCHSRKTRCSGYPACENCRHANVECRLYSRRQRAENQETIRLLRQRVDWLEREIQIISGLDCSSVPTGTRLESARHMEDGAYEAQRLDDSRRHDQTGPENITEQEAMVGRPLEIDDNFSAAISAPEISVLALNATGETSYLGPSSGIPFTGHAAAITRRLVSSRISEHVRTASENMTQSQISMALTDQDRVFDSGEAEGLVGSYLRWIQPLYPLFEAENLKATTKTCQELEARNEHGHDHLPEHALKMAEYYLVLALGAIHDGKFNEQVGHREQPPDPRCRPSPKRDPVRLYLKSLEYFELGSSDLQPSILLIRVILLMCIYGSHGKASLGQWQLAGIAVRMAVEIGLHQSSNTLHIADTEADARNRVFWTAYIIEILLAYNLGRPPSIGEEHITAKLPVIPSTMPICIHHIRHRQIQGRIVASVYGAAQKQQLSSEEHRYAILSNLQAELDEWRDSLREAFQSSPGSGYSYKYWERLYNGTSFVLYRSSPLCPRPAASALEKCIRAAAAYVDNMTDVIRNSRISLSWMLVQGVLFAGLTMLVTARTNFKKLLPMTGLQFFLADFPAWVRKCAICLAIMNERWNEDLLVTLESRFEALVNDTLKFISTNVTASLATVNPAADISRSHHLPDSESPTRQDLDGLQDQFWPIDDGLWNESAYMDFAMGSDFNAAQHGLWDIPGEDSNTFFQTDSG